MTARFGNSLRSAKTLYAAKRHYRTACHTGIPEHILKRQLAAKAAKCTQ